MSFVAAYTLDVESFTSTTGLETLEVLFEHYFRDDIELAGTITSMKELIEGAWEEGEIICKSSPQGWPGDNVDAATYFEQHCEQIGPQYPYDYYQKGTYGSPYHILACLSQVHDIVRMELDTRLVLQESINPSNQLSHINLVCPPSLTEQSIQLNSSWRLATNEERMKRTSFHEAPWSEYIRLQQKVKSNLTDLYVHQETMSFSCREFWAISEQVMWCTRTADMHLPEKEADDMFEVTEEASLVFDSTLELKLPDDVTVISETLLRTAEGVNEVLARMMSVVLLIIMYVLVKHSQARNTGVNLMSRDPQSFTTAVGLKTLQVLSNNYLPDDTELADAITSIAQAIDQQWKEGRQFWKSSNWCWIEGEGLVDAATCFQQYRKQLQPRDQYDSLGQYKLSLVDSIIQSLSEVHNQVTKELDTSLSSWRLATETERVKRSLFHGEPWGTFINRQQTLKNRLDDPNVNAETIGEALDQLLKITYKAMFLPSEDMSLPTEETISMMDAMVSFRQTYCLTKIKRYGNPDIFLSEEFANLQNSYNTSLQDMRGTFRFTDWFDSSLNDPAESLLSRQSVLRTKSSLETLERNELATIDDFVRQRSFLTDTATGLLDVTVVGRPYLSQTGYQSHTHLVTPPTVHVLSQGGWRYSKDAERSRRHHFYTEPIKSFRIDQQIVSQLWSKQESRWQQQSEDISQNVNDVMSYPTKTFVESVKNLVTQWYEDQVPFPEDVSAPMSQAMQSLWATLGHVDFFLQERDYISVAQLLLHPADEVSRVLSNLMVI
ncbi:hypothetical protein M231_03246 [Tremella mesenterica]|uniref:Uncharacterized protein n=1 Tax=Tremella mesenterica TaxID=5217 RepID=A0A4Q1BNF3_TREME|nr:hypothetical protein M231_03246 [Tremella mesenterica]